MPPPLRRPTRAPAWVFLALASLPAFSTIGCVSPGPDASRMTPQPLAAALAALAPHVDPAEADLLARVACQRSAELRREYHVIPPASLHNALVHLRIRRRGLCYHWSDDLAAALRPLALRTLTIHDAVAHPDDSLRVHYALVITASGRPFHTGLVLDPWRRSGPLHWSPLPSHKSPWHPLHPPTSNIQPQITNNK